MSYVDLADAKKYLVVIHSADDAMIQDCIDAAEDYAAQYMNRDGIYDEQNWQTSGDGTSSSTSSEEAVPKSVVQAIKILTAEYYEHRTQGIQGTIYTKMPAVDNMLHFYRIKLGV